MPEKLTISCCLGVLALALWQGPWRYWTTGESYPAGAILFFNAAACPSGWSEYTAARGRAMVGLVFGGTAGATVGTALTNQLNPPVGYHFHSVSDPQHGHSQSGGAHEHTVDRTYLTTGTLGDSDVASGSVRGVSDAFMNTSSASPSGDSSGVSAGIIESNTSGSVPGTPMPYVQLLCCRRD